MALNSGIRKINLTAHITFSVGWFGSVAGFLALAIIGLTSSDPQIIRSAYIAMELISWAVIVPACLGSFFTGLIQSLGTQWGLFKYYWILIKFVLTILATIVLILHMQPITFLGGEAQEPLFAANEFRELRIQLVADAGAALLVLLIAITLSVYKPFGTTAYGALSGKGSYDSIVKSSERISWKLYILLGLISLVILVFIILHLRGNQFHN